MHNIIYAAGMLVNIALIIGGVGFLVWMSTQGEADIIHQSNVLSVMFEASSLLLAVWIMFHAFKDNPKRPNLLLVVIGIAVIIIGTQVLGPLAGESYQQVGATAIQLSTLE